MFNLSFSRNKGRSVGQLVVLPFSESVKILDQSVGWSVGMPVGGRNSFRTGRKNDGGRGEGRDGRKAESRMGRK